MASISFTGPTLIFTDKSKIAGGIINEKSGGISTPISQAVIKIIDEKIFDNQRQEVANISGLVAAEPEAQRGGLAIEGLAAAGQADDDDDDDGPSATAQLRKLARMTPGLRVSRRNPSMGPIQTQNLSDDGFITLGQLRTWRPRGQSQRRKIGDHMVHYVVADASLAGQVEPVREIGQFAIVQGNLEFGGACGACGVCGVCTLCGELNAASAVAAIQAISSILSANTAPQHAAEIERHLSEIKRLSGQ